jgi:hypothetical protein
MNRFAALPLSLALLAAAGCQPAMEGQFDFDDSFAGDLSSQTYAVGARVDMVIWGPAGFDMNLARARSLNTGDDADRVVDITVDTAYPEYGCVVAEGEAVIDGEARIAIADRLTGAPLDTAPVTTAVVDRIDLGRSVDSYGGRVDDAVLGATVHVVSGGATSLGMAALDDQDRVLAGRFPLDVDATGVDASVWDDGYGSVVHIANAQSGHVSVDAAGHQHEVDVVAVAPSDIIAVRLDEKSVSVGGNLMLEGSQSALLLSGITAAGDEVLGLQATWTIDGWDYGVGDAMTLWAGEGGDVQVCWNGLCASN